MFLFKCPDCVLNNENLPTPSRNVGIAATPSSIHSGNVDDEVRKQLDPFKLEVQKQLHDINKRMEEVVQEMRLDYDKKIKKIEEETMNCSALVKQCESRCDNAIQDIEAENDISRRRLNRANIVINGLPRGILDLREPITKIAALCNVELRPSDIQHCCYFNGGKSVLLKLNSVYTRDCIMVNFNKRSSLLLCDVVGGEVRSKVYLNDHLCRATSKLLFVCRKLKRQNKVKKFKLFNADRATVELEMTNGSRKVLNLTECAEMLDTNDAVPSDIPGTLGSN